MNPTEEHIIAAALNGGSEVSTEVLATLAEIGEEVNASLDLDEVLARAAALIKRHIDYEIFGVLMIECDGSYLRHVLAIRYTRVLTKNLRMAKGQRINTMVDGTMNSIMVSNTSMNTRYSNAIGRKRR